jgi:hypothetical protein
VVDQGRTARCISAGEESGQRRGEHGTEGTTGAPVGMSDQPCVARCVDRLKASRVQGSVVRLAAGWQGDGEAAPTNLAGMAVRGVSQQVQDRVPKAVVSMAQKGIPEYLPARASECASPGVMPA